MKTRLYFILVMTALLCATRGTTLADAYSQYFTGWSATMTQNPVDISKDGWALNDGYIHRNALVNFPFPGYSFPSSPHPEDTADCACWLADDAKSTNSSLTTPLLISGVESISFYARNFFAGVNNFALQMSTNGVVWTTLTNLQHTTENWTQYQLVIHEYQSVYLRILKTGESGGHASWGQLFGIDDIIITRPPASVAISNLQSDPEYPIQENPIDLTCRIVQYGDVSGFTVTSFWRVGTNGLWTPTAMTTNGSPTNYITISPIPAQGPNDSLLQYYITAYFSGTNAMSPTNYPVGGASAPTTLFYREAEVRTPQFFSHYTNMAVTGSFDTNLALISDYVRQGVVSAATNIVNGAFQFLATNAGGNILLGETNQPFTDLPVFGVAETNGAAIAVSGTNTGYFAFRFDETINDYSARKCVYIHFDDWSSAANSYTTHTNNDGWIIGGARTTKSNETNYSYRADGRACVLNEDVDTQYVLSPCLSNGVGEVAFWYANWETNGLTPTAFDVQISASASGGWTTVSTVTNVVNVAYKRFSHTLSDITNYYVRILHATNPPRARLLLDEIVVADAGPGVGFSSLIQTPSSPTILDAVDVQVNISNWNHATNLNATLWYRYGTTGAFEAISMTNAGATYNAVSDMPRYPPGVLQYYIACSFDGLTSKSQTYFYYPRDGISAPVQYAVADLVATQYFWTGWSATLTTTPADVSKSGWYLNDGYIHRNALVNFPFPGYAFPASPYSANSSDCAAWLADRDASTNSYFLTPQLPAGIGRISFYTYTFYSGDNDFSIQTSTNLTDWTSVTNLEYSAESWNFNTHDIYDFRPIYLRIFKTDESGGHSTWGQLLGLDDIKVSYAPAMVLIANVMTHPGYPSEGENVNISCVITSTHPYFLARNISARVYYRNSGAGSYSGPIEMTGNGDYFLTQSPIPSQAGGMRMEYYIECAFNGYAYTNVENHSPTFYPAGTSGVMTNQYYAAPTNNPAVYDVRRYKSEYDHVEVTGNVGVVNMGLVGDNEWQSILDIRDMQTPTNRLTVNFAGIGQYTNMANSYSAAIPSWGDSYQSRFGLPLASEPQDNASNIVININTQEQNQIMFRYDTVNNFYTITRAAYQDFNKWQAPEDVFAESLGLTEFIGITNIFDSWPTSVTEVAQPGVDLEDFASWTVTTNYYTTNEWGGSVGWYVENALILNESGQSGANQACRLRNLSGLGTVWPHLATVPNGVKTFEFDYRAKEDDHYHTWYANGVNWTNYYVQATLRSTNMAPDFPYLSMLARYQNEDNYYELRLQQMSFNQLYASLWRRTDGSYSLMAGSAWFNGSLNNQNVCGLLVVTNNAGYVYLEGYASVGGAAITNKISVYDTSANRITSPGSIGFLTRGADIAVDDITVRRADAQRFAQWSQGSYGTYTSANWIVTGAQPTANYCIIDTFDPSQTALSFTNFDGWSGAGSWGAYTNGNWILSNGRIDTTYGARSPPNAAWLKHDTNSYLQFANTGVNGLSFYCRNEGTNAIPFDIQTSRDGATDWQTYITLTNTTLDYSYKAKFTFSGYSKNETLTNFPALITLGTNISGFSYGQFLSTNGADLRFTDAGQTVELNYEIEQWNTNGSSYVWVQVPALSNSAAYIWAYWGASSMSNAPSYTTNGATWNADYEGVWHGSRTNDLDSTGNGHNGTAQGSVTSVTNGKIARANDFDADTDYISVPDTDAFTLSGDYSVSAWIYSDALADNEGFVGTYNGAGFIFALTNATGNPLRFWSQGWRGSNASIADGVWKHVAYTRKGTEGRFYIDGVTVEAVTNAIAGSDGGDLNIGAGGTNWTSYRFDGRVDEVQISTVRRSSNWIWASWMNAASNLTFTAPGTVTAGSGSIETWRNHYVEIPSVLAYARIAKNQTTGDGQWLGIDDVTVRMPTYPAINSPYIEYQPGALSFMYRRYDGSLAEMEVYGSADGTNWGTAIYTASGFGTSSNLYNSSADLSGYRYIRIVNPSPTARLRIDDIYITESSNWYAESFTNGLAQDWDTPYGKWYLPATNDTTYNRAGYAGAPVGFDIQMAFAGGVLPTGSGAEWITVRSLTASNLNYKTAAYNFEYWDEIFARVRHTDADASLVVDNLKMSSWRGENYTDTNTGWAATEAWITNRYVGLWRSRADTNALQYIRSPWLTNGVGDINFYCYTTNGPAQLEIQRTVEGTSSTYVTFQTLTINSNSWAPRTVQLNTASTGLYVRLLHSSAINTNVLHLDTNNEPVIYIDNLEIRDYTERDQTMWYAYNALITYRQDSREFEPYYTPDYAVRSCYLNNSPSNDAPSGPFTNDFPFVQSSYLSKGIGEISFWYRAWDTNPATIRVRAAESDTLAPGAWTNLVELFNITNTFYRYFTTNLYITDQRFLRIYSSNEPAGRACIDNVLITEPLGADFDVVNITLAPKVPIYTNNVGISAQLTGFLLDPSDIDLRLYYNVGSNNWGNWAEGTNYVTLQNVSNTVYSRFYEVPAGQGISPQPIDAIVQYHLLCSFNGTFADKASPKREKSFTNPAWYYPVDLNAGQTYTNPYYIVFSCPTGSVWINEFNVVDNFAYTNQYVELCGYSNAVISNWWIEVFNTSFVTTQVYRITNNATLTNDYAGYGFWMLGADGIAQADMFLTNALGSDGGLLLRRSMGAYEHGVCYGDSDSVAVRNMTNSPHRLVYVGDDDEYYSYSIGLSGAGSNAAGFAWVNADAAPTPGAVNNGQKLAWLGDQPPWVGIVITNFWTTVSSNWIAATGTNTWMHTLWYSTNLQDTNSWLPIAGAGYVYSDSGVYTQWFSLMTNSQFYFYKIIATNGL